MAAEIDSEVARFRLPLSLPTPRELVSADYVFIFKSLGLDFLHHHVYYSGHMDVKHALAAFSALSQETRLRVFRLLVEYGPPGAPAGALSESLSIPHNTLSFHLSHMSHAGLVESRREGRSIIYSANFEFFSELIRYMVEDCCRDEFASIRKDKKRNCSIIELSHCCQPKEE